jgi:hypothetical protein
MDTKDRDEKVAMVKEQIAKLEEINVDALSDEDLESVAGGFCSFWCCSAAAQVDQVEGGA